MACETLEAAAAVWLAVVARHEDVPAGLHTGETMLRQCVVSTSQITLQLKPTQL